MLLENCAYPRDGRVRKEARALAEAGYRVTVIAPAAKGEAWQETVDGVHVYRYPASPAAQGFLGYLLEYGYSLAAAFFLAMRSFLREGFDIIHAHHPPDAFVFIAAFFKLLGKRYILDHHDLAPELYNARFSGPGNHIVYRMLVWLERLSCRLADHVIATNQSYKAVEMERGHVPEENITIVRNGPDLNELQISEPDLSLRKDGKTLIGYVGVMGNQDGVDYLVRALQHLVKDLGRKDFFCILVGSGVALSRLKSLCQKLDLMEYVLFTGWINNGAQIALYLVSVDVCVAPEPSNLYNDRSTAIKIMEYMAFAKPTVAFDLPEHNFTARGAAVYARPNEELDFAKQIALLMDDPERRKRMGEIGRERIEKELGWHHQGQALLKAYKTLLSQREGE
jgi:glycosyltransferase involved in cell wall biosynthesis